MLEKHYILAYKSKRRNKKIFLFCWTFLPILLFALTQHSAWYIARYAEHIYDYGICDLLKLNIWNVSWNVALQKMMTNVEKSSKWSITFDLCLVSSRISELKAEPYRDTGRQRGIREHFPSSPIIQKTSFASSTDEKNPAGLATNSIFFCLLFLKTHWFAWRANQWSLVKEILFS